MLRTVPPLMTERLKLEPLRLDHAAEMVAVLADPALYEFIGGEAPSEVDLTARYERQTSRAGWLNWVLRLRDTGEPIGTVQATQKDEHSAELAWLLSPRFQGTGYATEGTAAAIAWLSEQGIDSFDAYINPDHAASSAVAARLGFVSTESIRNGETRWSRAGRCQN